MSFSFEEIALSVLYAIIYGVFISSVLSPLLFFINSALTTFFSVFLFGVGYMLLSYYSLDGELRFYTLFLSACAFLISKTLVFDRIFGALKSMAKKVAKIPIFGKIKRRLSLDKTKEKC
jgi:hypothetical protein